MIFKRELFHIFYLYDTGYQNDLINICNMLTFVSFATM